MVRIPLPYQVPVPFDSEFSGHFLNFVVALNWSKHPQQLDWYPGYHLRNSRKRSLLNWISDTHLEKQLSRADISLIKKGGVTFLIRTSQDLIR